MPTEVSIEKLTDTKSYRDYYALTFGSAYKEWVSSITAIKVGETAYTKVDSTDELNVQTYYLGDDGTMGIYLTGGFSDTTYQLTCITEVYLVIRLCLQQYSDSRGHGQTVVPFLCFGRGGRCVGIDMLPLDETVKKQIH